MSVIAKTYAEGHLASMILLALTEVKYTESVKNQVQKGTLRTILKYMTHIAGGLDT